jgi:hypothetical protein
MAKLRTKTMAEKFLRLHESIIRGGGMTYHQKMIRAASILRDHKVHPKKAVEIIHEASEKVSRRKPAIGEIERIVAWVYRTKTVMDGMKKYEKPGISARRNQAIIDEWASKGSLKSLKQRSRRIPVKPEWILKDLYHDNELLHISPDIYHDTIKPTSQWIDEGLSGMQYFCPCVFKGTEKGRLAENVDRRKYVVFETDERPQDWDGQCGLIDRLSQELDLVMVTASGNKSLHALFDTSTPCKDRIQKFTDLVITLGGDLAVLRPAQMVRFPWGINSKTNQVQEVLFYAR